MAKELLDDELWGMIQPLIPAHPPRPKGGRTPKDDRACLTGILYVLRTGCQWQMLPKETFLVSGSTCWRRFNGWSRKGVWPRVHQEVLNQLGKLGQVDPSAAVVDSASVRAVFGGFTPAPAPWIAGKTAANGT
jgi:transposase